jgi:hypothetical protein
MMGMDVNFWDELIGGLDATDLEWLMLRIQRRRDSLHPEKIARKIIIRKIGD